MPETNAERLESIDVMKSYLDGAGVPTHIFTRSLKSVIEEAERVQELEKENARLEDDWKGIHEVLRKSIELLDAFEKENKRLREKLGNVELDKEEKEHDDRLSWGGA